jgi:phosphoribosylanthranilate isomerase
VISPTKVKICGVTIVADALAVAASGAELIGLNLWPGSKRHITVANAKKLASVIRAAAPNLQLVGVFVDATPEAVAAAAEDIGLDIVQLHGDESPNDCAIIAAATQAKVWKAIAVAKPSDLANLARWPVDAILVDTPSPARGGSGMTFDWAIAREATAARRDRRLVLAGGLTPANVAAAIAAVTPWAVDVASGVELQPGLKDHAKLRAFVAAARGR